MLCLNPNTLCTPGSLHQEFVYCILMITWMGYDLTQAISLGVHTFFYIDLTVSPDVQFKCVFIIDASIQLIGIPLPMKDQLENMQATTITSPMKLHDHCQEIDYIEYFAGVGNLTRQMRAMRYRSARLDIKDYARKNPKTKSNYMDMNTGAGYAFLGLE